jgi:hypothetical protein
MVLITEALGRMAPSSIAPAAPSATAAITALMPLRDRRRVADLNITVPPKLNKYRY